jgi:hypothetical protein
MVKHLMKIIFIGMILHLNAVFAEMLRDPTMPPPAFLGTGAEVSQTPTGPVLQSVTLGTTAKFAMISGETVRLGQKYQDYVLVQLKADEAKLRAKDGTSLVLKMDFQIQKKPLNMNKSK